MGIITLSKVDSLWWLGRYTERVFTTLKTFFPYYDTCLDHEPERFRVFSDALDVNADMSDFETFLYDFLYSKSNVNSVCASMNAAFDNAVMLRPEIGTDTLAYIELALNTLRDSKTSMEGRLDKQRAVGDHLLTFWGALEDSTSSPDVKAFVMAGKYLERIDLYSRFKKPDEMFAAPVVRLNFNLGMLPDKARGLLAEAVGSVADAVARRGYSAEVVSRVRNVAPEAVLDDDGNVLAAGVAVES